MTRLSLDHIYKKLTLLAMGMMTLCACSLNVPPPDQFADPDAITDTETARSLLASCYLSFPHNEYDFSVLGNDLCPTSLAGKDVEELNLYNWQDKNISNFSTTVWQDYYTCISNCDVLLERIDNITTENESDKQKKAAIKAETQALKAMCYFDLLRIYATPYDNNPDGDGIVVKNMFGYESNKRSTKKGCIDMIERLLNNALTVENNPEKNGWLSQTAVRHLLAETALYKGDYANAASLADEVIATGDDSQIGGSNYSRIWSTSTCKGRIFAFSTSSTFFTNIEYDTNEGDYYALNPAFTFADNDVRKPYTIYNKVMKGEERQLLGKYNMMNKEGTSPTYINRMRYAGAYFIAAEAYARSGNDARARERANHYLTLVCAENISDSTTGQELIDAIMQEKYKEFAGEGANWFDMKRTHSDISRLTTWGKATSSHVTSTDYRWTFPIPASEYKYNDNITQNDHWGINR